MFITLFFPEVNKIRKLVNTNAFAVSQSRRLAATAVFWNRKGPLNNLMLMGMGTSSASWGALKKDWTYILYEINLNLPALLILYIILLLQNLLSCIDVVLQRHCIVAPWSNIPIPWLKHTFRLELDKYVQGLNSSLQTPEVRDCNNSIIICICVVTF